MTNNSDFEYKTFEIKTDSGTHPFDMVEVHAGSFMMGSDEFEESQPVHEVTINKNYYIAKYPVTQSLWTAIMGNNPSHFKGENRPVEKITSSDAKKFIKKLNDLYDDEDSKQFHLPTESQWEFAARAGEEGAKEKLKYAGSNRIKEVGWYYKNSNGATKPVGLKMPNQLGLYDMSGNVWEWCEDNYIENYHRHPKDGSALINDNRLLVVRGGSWFNNDDFCSVFNRNGVNLVVRVYFVGFRLSRY